LSGKAAAFFMCEVSMSICNWELDEFLTCLFDHCFPSNFHTGQWTHLSNCRQNSHAVGDCIFELQNLADSVGDILDWQLVLYLWQGVDDYICAKWAE
ncbi:hypothetical protein IW261DRAFT_1307682, partial [Armillaria novae-zelandiae]